MALGDYTYRLKAEAGDSTPHDELGLSGDLSGGTITLEDDGGGGKCWQFIGTAQASGPSLAINTGADGDGFTIACRLRVVSGSGSSGNIYFAYKSADTNAYGLMAVRDGTGTLDLRYRSGSGIKSAVTAYSHGSGWVTYVIRLKTLAAASSDSVSAWYTGGGSHPTADGTNGPSSGFGNITAARIEIGCSDATLQVSDFVTWGEELADADNATLVDSGIRATLDGGGSSFKPYLLRNQSRVFGMGVF